ncbi:F0F1 ATP synthase subunit gamma [Corynebacterium diphtheriae]
MRWFEYQLFKALVKGMAVNRENGVEIDLCVVGSKGAAFFRNFGGNVVAAISHLGEEPSINDLIGSVKVMLDAYLEGRIDRLSVVSNKFINTMTQQPTVEQLIPLVATPDQPPPVHDRARRQACRLCGSEQ